MEWVPMLPSKIVKLMTERRILVSESKILILGLAFRRIVPIWRNSKVVDIVTELAKFDAKVEVYDPWVDADSAEREYGIRPIKAPKGRQLRRSRACRCAQ